MEKRQLNTTAIVEEFGEGSALARQAVEALRTALREGLKGQSLAAAWERWIGSWQFALGGNDARIERGLNALAQRYSRESEADPRALLLAVQTYYVWIVKFLVWRVASEARPTAPLLTCLAHALESSELLPCARQMECHVASLLCDGDKASRDPWTWYLDAWTEPVSSAFHLVAQAWARFDSIAASEAASELGDVLSALYEQIFPKRVRHALGEYYTPDWLVEQLLDEAGFTGEPGARVLDPACGSGRFLLAAVRRLRAAWSDRAKGGKAAREGLRHAILSSVVGIDLNPLAVLTAKANYLIAIMDLLPADEPVALPVVQGDSILGRHESLPGGDEGFDCVVGNPPWIAWDDLSQELRQATQPLWRRYGLFTLRGADARHGGGKKDLSMLMIYAAADRYLKPGGRLAMVVTQTVFQTRGAGDGFRRFRLGEDGPWLQVLRVHDLVERRPFPGAANWSATLLVQKGSPTVFPVPYVKHSADGRVHKLQARPIDSRRSNSPWFVHPDARHEPFGPRIGPSCYEAHLGANSGGANGVFWVTLCGDGPEENRGKLTRIRNLAEQGKRRTDVVEQQVERELLFPLVRWGDVDRFHARPSAWLLLPQDVHLRRGIAESEMRARFPETYDYLSRFREQLEDRAAYRRYQSRAPFYSMYDVGPYTLAPFKVVWRRMDRRIRAAVLEPYNDPRVGLRPIVPQETCTLVAADSADEAHYLCAVLNSATVDFIATSHQVRGGKSFGSPGMMEYLGIDRFDPHLAIHRALSEASKAAHRLAGASNDISRRTDILASSDIPANGDIAAIQSRIDALAADCWASRPLPR